MSLRFWILPSFAILAAALVVLAQSGERPLQKLFTPAATKKSTAEDVRRVTEITVELAWLADPITFPYYLEARVDGASLTVRGFVPDKAVREHALRLAKVHSSYGIIDGMKEHPSLRVRPGQTTPAQLQSAVTSALREALGKQQAQRLQTMSAADGKVTITGQLKSAEEKLAASVALRRLYGCTSVQNLAQVPGMPDLAQGKAPVAPKDSVAKSDAPKDIAKNPRPTFGPPTPATEGTVVAKADKPPMPPTKPAEGPSLFPVKGSEPPAKKPEVAKEPPAKKPEVAKDPPAKTTGKLTLSTDMIAMLQKRVQAACPEASDVKLEVAMNKLRVEMTVRSDDQITPCAEKAFNVPELAEYRDDLELVFAVAPK